MGEPRYRPSVDQLRVTSELRRHAEAFARQQGRLTTVLLVGPRGAGKTRLLLEADAMPLDLEVVDAENLRPLDLFADINRCASRSQLLLIEARTDLDRWFAGDEKGAPPDLLSRLEAAPLLSLERPGPSALLPVLLDDLAAHGERLRPGEVEWVVEQLPRSFSAPRAFCRALDAAPAGLARQRMLQWAVEQAHLRPAEQSPRKDRA